VTGFSSRLKHKSQPPSAKRAVDGDLVQSVLENGELLIVELRDEQFRDPAQMDGSAVRRAIPP
jgi:hypothetical protein